MVDFVTYDYVDFDINSLEFELKNNKCLVVPTDTVSGIISLNKNNIYKIKKRPKNKKIITFVSDINQVNNKNDIFIRLAKKFWPGKLTLIFNGESYRMPNEKLILDLINRVGPLHSSSANLSGNEPIRNYEELKRDFLEYKNLVVFVNANYKLDNEPSTIYDIDKNKIIREGEIKHDELKKWI